ncbi:hypothetical protein L484_020634 [Morus notabilis]|uniref:Shugoshin C-terminal domain-containing protein n=1 Tax=Morus notabilis TaxID=981085 RepID=W9S975_9ROSA|nr:hypothetical protein L484_020634 [Morus notabilis]
MAKRASFGNVVLKKLSDITNLQTVKFTSQDEKPVGISDSDKGKIDQLIKERMSWMKLIAERNKIIELSGAELQNLRVSLQKLQLQNWNLAQSNSQMLAELNLGRERIKALQHELRCKDALLKAKNLCQEEGEEAASNVAGQDEKPHHRNRRRAARSQSMGPSTTSQKHDDKEVENKRRCVRRQSVQLKSHERKPTENLFEIEDAKFDSPKQTGKENREESCIPNSEAGVTTRRSSLGRPMRKAVVKVQSYKEVPLKFKMRRVPERM